MLLFETERKVEERDVEDSGELEKEDNSDSLNILVGCSRVSSF